MNVWQIGITVLILLLTAAVFYWVGVQNGAKLAVLKLAAGGYLDKEAMQRDVNK